MSRWIAVIILVISLISTLPPLRTSNDKVYVAFIWHYHQPWYYSVDEQYFALPWVRMHSVGNYFKMGYILSRYPDVKATFTFSGSLLEQLVDYIENGRMDLRELISWRIVNGSVDKQDIFDMLRIPGGFFDINWGRIVERSPRYKELRDFVQKLHSECIGIAKTSEEYVECVVDGFTSGDLLSQNVVDLAVLFNLLWIDPQVAKDLYPQLQPLIEKAFKDPKPSYTRNDLEEVLKVHRDLMSRLPSLYRELATKGQAELIPVPYSHPIAPLLLDSGFDEDLEIHIEKSLKLFKEYLGIEPVGVWPAEQAVNEYTLKIFAKKGFRWTVTDSSLLSKAGIKVDIDSVGVPWYIDFPEGRVYIFFRETELSNLISFQYSTWDTDKAVNDLVNKVLRYAQEVKEPRIVIIALDGENPWENYEEFGDLFLNKLYTRLSELQKQGVLETITPREFIEKFGYTARELPEKEYLYLDLVGKDISDIPRDSYGDGYTELPRRKIVARLPEGSWSGGELATWIGHRQENVAWMWLVKAREDVMKSIGVKNFKDLYSRRPDVATYILKAEASDWWWWYGGDGGGSPATFDPLFKAYLRKAYELSNLAPPPYLLTSAYPDGTPVGTLNTTPPTLADKSIVIDGFVEPTWRTLVNEGKALRIVVGSTVPEAFIAINTTFMVFAFNLSTKNINNTSIAVYFTTASISMSPYKPRYNVYPRGGEVDLGIHLAKEILIEIVGKRITISNADGYGGWEEIKTLNSVALGKCGDSYCLELAVNIDDLALARNTLTFLAVVVYRDSKAVEWSTRLGLAHQVFVPQKPAEFIGRVLLNIADPEEDDDGVGGLTYPTNPVFKPGVFDLTRFTLVDAGEKLVMRFTFRELGGNPWGGPNGWSLQQVHVYIRTTLHERGNLSAIALNFVVEHGWHMAILVAPGWGSDPLPIGERTALYYFNKREPIIQDGDLKSYADPATKSIVVEVSKKILLDIENLGKWVLVVAVTSHDGYGVNRVRPFVVGGGEWAVGVPQKYALAILRNLVPFVIDLLAPSKDEQYTMLNSFDVDKGEFAKVRGVNVSTGEVVKTVTVPQYTATVSETATSTPSTTPLTNQSATPTPTSTPSPQTSASNVTSISTPMQPSTKPVPIFSIAVTIAVIIAVIVIAVVIISKRR